MNEQILAEAIAWLVRGYTPLPVRADGTKAPAVRSWKEHARDGITADQLPTIFNVEVDGLGLLCGAVSGNLEMLELEGRAVKEGILPALITALADHGMRALWDRIAAGYVELTPSGGLHYHYRVDGPARGNTKLARRPSTPDELAAHPGQRVQVLVETRGEGGFTVVAPSGGRTHPTGRSWTVLGGSRDTIPTLTVDERDALHAIACTLDQVPATTWMPPQHNGTQPENAGGRPGDDFNERGTWDFLTAAGWQPVRRFGPQRVGWVRPGKHPNAGISATTGGAADGKDRLFVFTTATEFEAERPYDRFSALAQLEHGGDLAACARRLAAEGWGAGPVDTGPALTIAPDPSPPDAPPAPGTQQQGARVIDFPGPRAAAPTSDGTAALAPDAPPADIALARYGQTEDGVARALVDQCADQLRYCPQRGLWLVWNGARWEWDERELHREHAKRMARQLPDNDLWRRFRGRALSASGIAGIVGLARTDPAITIHLDDLDAHPWQLNTPGGIIDMRTGTLTPADRDALHSRTTTVTPDYDNPAPVWERFLDDTFGGDQVMIGFVQRLLGVSAVGQVVEQQLPFAFGPGANGKSTLMNVVMKILGRGRDGYSIALDAEALMVRRNSEHPAELAQLAGARMVVSSEIEDGQRFAEARVKQLTGGDAISARFMRGNPFTFTPTHTLWLVGNHQPGTTAGGPAFWRRIKLIPFDHVVPEDRRDPHLEDKLMAEAPQILAWIARGAAAYHAHGLGVPGAVQAATEAYRDDQDSVGKFVAERCMRTAAGRVRASELRAAYEAFCRESGDAPVTAKRFGEQLRDQHGVALLKGAGGVRMYQGVTLYADEEEPVRDDWHDR